MKTCQNYFFVFNENLSVKLLNIHSKQLRNLENNNFFYNHFSTEFSIEREKAYENYSQYISFNFIDTIMNRNTIFK